MPFIFLLRFCVKRLWHEFETIREKSFMMNFLESIGIVENETDRSFKMAPAIIMMVLMLAFFGTIVYICISSLD